jgi:aldose 1-epimerase
MLRPTLLLLTILMSVTETNAANYNAKRATVDGIEVIQLSDASHKTEVSIVPSIGNTAYEMKVNGKDVFWSPYRTLAEFKAKPAQLGVPFLAPWANRIDGDTYYVNGKKYHLNPDLGNYRLDGNHKPIHGLLVHTNEWKVVNLTSDANSAAVTSRIEFSRHPEWMAQFPFAHNIEMTYKLAGGVLEVQTVIENLSAEPMPVSIGYHPYFAVHDAPRDAWKLHLPVTKHFKVDSNLIPSGELQPSPFSDPQTLGDIQIDDGFTGLTRGSDGRAEFTVQG